MKDKFIVSILALALSPSLLLADRPSFTTLNERTTDLEVCSGSANAPTRFVDNGDGTICDNHTGLMWEKKDAADGVQNLANPHDVDNQYTWTDNADLDFTNPDGTLFTDFLAKLNSDATDDPSRVGFADHTDWRIPTVVELQTLLFEPDPCSISPCIIDPIFAPTVYESYWSSSSLATTPGAAWVVVFGNGFLWGNNKSSDFTHVRAVRGGR